MNLKPERMDPISEAGVKGYLEHVPEEPSVCQAVALASYQDALYWRGVVRMAPEGDSVDGDCNFCSAKEGHEPGCPWKLAQQ